MKLKLFTILGLCLSLTFAACDDDDTNDKPMAGEVAGEMAGEVAGEMAGEVAGEMAGEVAGEMAGEVAGEVAGEEMMAKNIVETAVEAGSFTTLVAAVEAAGLVELLSGEGPFTVLAPNDDAFANLAEGTVESLVEDANNGGDQLANILKLHAVVGAAVMSSELTDGQVVTTANGDLTVGISAEGVVTFTIGESVATVIAADIEASNGVIHVIDTVLMPPAEETAPMNIVETAIDNGSFTTLVAAVEAAGFVDVLTGEGPFTVLAPTDAAFEALPEGKLDMLLTDAEAGGTMLADILNLHVVVGAAVMSGDLVDGQAVTTANGELTVSVTESGVSFSSEGTMQANVLIADVEASNGVIHAIDAVLLPAAN